MYYLGVDVGGTNICAGVIDEKFNILKKNSCKTNIFQTMEKVCDDIEDLCIKTLTDIGLKTSDISYVGIGVPGSVNTEKGIVEYLPNLFFNNWPLVKMMEERLKIKVLIENDANAAAFGEYIINQNKNINCAIMITIGTGIGSGIILDGKIYSGSNYNGAELGHMVICMDGRKCACGRCGCFESYASASGLILTTKEMLKANTDKTVIWEMISENINNVTAKTAFDAMRLGDELGKKIVNMYTNHLSCGLVNVVNIFQPDIIYIGGGVSNEGEMLLNPVRKYIERERYSKHAKKQTQIAIATLGNDAGVIGAALIDSAKN
ncbi:MAG: Glucokinase [Eubacteriales bacterium SKADARSKE-1]|nr:Glucokinase [Eubacteriales bacterium SKADARSKE-1]